MIIQCAKCSTKFRLDDSLITGTGVKVRCTKCQEVFVVTPPEKAPQGAAEQPPQAEAKGAEAASKKDEGAKGKDADAGSGAKPGGAGNVLRFDFERPSDKAKAAPPPEEKAKGPAEAAAKDFEGEKDAARSEAAPSAQSAPAETGLLGNEAGAEGEAAAPEPQIPSEPRIEKPGRENLEFKFDEGAKSTTQERLDKLMHEEPDFKFGEEEPRQPAPSAEPTADIPAPGEPAEAAARKAGREETTLESTPAEEESAAKSDAAKAGAEEEFWKNIVQKNGGQKTPNAAASAAAESYLSAGIEPPAKEDGKKDSKGTGSLFDDLLSKTLAGSEKGLPGEAEEEHADDDAEKKPEKAKPQARQFDVAPGPMSYVSAAVILIVGGLFIYLTGLTDAVTKSIVGSAPAQTRTMEVASIKGYGAENKNAGQLFIIEGTIKNLTDKAQTIKSVRGAVYDGSGKKLAEKTSAPGRVFQPEDIKGMAVEDLLKTAKDPAGAVLPARGTLPVMVLFDKPPQGAAEVGIEVIR